MDKDLSLNIKDTSIIRQQNGFHFNWILSKDFPFLEGHFPNNPILPAVITLELALSGLKSFYNNKNIKINSISNAKFMQIITIDTLLKFQYKNLKPIDQSWSVDIIDVNTNTCVSVLKFSIIKN